MSWFLQKLDAFLAAAVIALTAAVASQGQAFVVQYLQRAGGHLDEARSHLADVQTGLRYRVMGETVRGELEVDAKARVAVLTRAYESVKNANVFVRPLAILRNGEADIVAGTRRDFVPALPLDADSITYTFIGAVAGFILYEIVRLPVLLLAREPRRRKFRKRG
jgi:hypothetical protein